MSTFACYPVFGLSRIHVIGCGGTGSRLVPLLAQFLATLPNPETKEILLYDFDIIEEKNLKRQNFVSIDVGKYKSEVLAARYSAAFRVPIKAFRTAYAYAHDPLRVKDIVVMCVDSVEARKQVFLELRNVLRSGAASAWPGILVLDAGNEDAFGQIAAWTLVGATGLYSQYINRQEDPNTGLVDLEVLPMPLDHYLNLFQGTSSGPSCADLDQTLAVNAQMGVGLISLLQNWHYRKPVRHNITYYNLTGTAAAPALIGKDSFKLWGFESVFDALTYLAARPHDVPISVRKRTYVEPAPAASPPKPKRKMEAVEITPGLLETRG